MIKGEIGIIGGGNMGIAVAEGLRTRRGSRPPVTIATPHPDRAHLRRLATDHDVHLTRNNLAAAQRGETVVLAVKPFKIPEVLEQIKDAVDGKLVISLAAGVPLPKLQDSLRPSEARVVRAMPNLGARVGESMTAWTSDGLSRADAKKVTSLLSSLGDVLEVPSDDAIDQITALAGSGPGYFFYMAEVIEQQALRFGYPPAEARRLVRQTLLGAAKVLDESGQSPEELRRAVTSKGGTTEAAVTVFDQQDLQAIIREGINAAYKRSQELSQQ